MRHLFVSRLNLLSVIMAGLWGINAQLNTTTTPSLNITTIAAVNNASVLQCWQLASPFTTSMQSGTSGALNQFLGNLTNASYTVIPPRYDAGLHTAPTSQFVVALSGLTHVTLPNTTANATTEAWIQGGKYGLVLAVDTPDVSRYGHISTYPSDADTILIQFPVSSPVKHSVLYDGPCRWSELIGV